MRLVYESKDPVEKSFRTYHGRFPSGYDGAESISCRSFNAPPSEPVNNASTSRQSQFNCDNCEDDKLLKTYHVAPISGPDSRDSRPTSRDGSESPQHSDDYGESTSFFGEGASSGSFGDGSDPSRDSRGIGKGCGRSRRGHHVRDGCGGFVGDGSSSSVGSGGFTPRAVPRNLSALASSDIIVSKLMRSLLSHRDYDSIFRAATEPPDEKYLIGRLQVDHKSFDNANRLADFVSNYQLCLAKLRERFATSSDPDFNTVCDNLALEEQLFYHCWTTNDSDLLYDHLTNNILPVLENYYRDHELAGTWAGHSTWAFKCKRYPDGRVKKFKARFCARGDRQVEGAKTNSSRLVSSNTQDKTSFANIEKLLQEQLAAKLAKD
eukprot:scaffold15927_cov76-Cyclotella_meneghiniana.AAC.1